MLFGRVVYNDVDLLIDSLNHNVLAEFFVSHVAVDKKTFSLVLLDQLLGLAGLFVLLKINDRHICSLFYKCNCHRATNPAIAAGNDRHFIVQFAAAALGFIPRFWPRLHLVARGRADESYAAGATSFSLSASHENSLLAASTAVLFVRARYKQLAQHDMHGEKNSKKISERELTAREGAVT